MRDYNLSAVLSRAAFFSTTQKKKTKRKETRRYVHDQGKRGKYAKTNWTG